MSPSPRQLPTKRTTNIKEENLRPQRDSNPLSSNKAAPDLHLRPQGHRDQQSPIIFSLLPHLAFFRSALGGLWSSVCATRYNSLLPTHSMYLLRVMFTISSHYFLKQNYFIFLYNEKLASLIWCTDWILCCIQRNFRFDVSSNSHINLVCPFYECHQTVWTLYLNSVFQPIPFHCLFIVIKYIEFSESEMREINWIVSLVCIN